MYEPITELARAHHAARMLLAKIALVNSSRMSDPLDSLARDEVVWKWKQNCNNERFVNDDDVA